MRSLVLGLVLAMPVAAIAQADVAAPSDGTRSAAAIAAALKA